MSVYAVNSKEPLSCWIPSLDTAGNGTATLNDLVGSNPLTLNNFALTGSTSNWVADTNAGGIRALDFDGTNDYGSGSYWTTLGSFGAAAFSLWVRSDGKSNFGIIGTSGFGVFSVYSNTSANIRFLIKDTSNLLNGAITVSAWTHVVATYDGTTARLYINGTQTASKSVSGTLSNSGSPFYLGSYYDTTFVIDGRLDDVRGFNQNLDASDVAYLYFSGSGRGRLAVSGESRRRRQSVSGGVL
jgi:hypothetical protein